MNVTFITNFFNHHQKALSDEFFRVLKNKYHFIETVQMPNEREKLGYTIKSLPEYVISTYKEKNEELELKNKYMQAEVIIAGSIPDKILFPYNFQNRILFKYSERPLKDGIEIFKYPIRFIRWHICYPQNRKTYLLAASAFAVSDYRKFGLFNNKAFKWGYFPETKKYENIQSLIEKKNKNSILWVGRFLPWKHPEVALQIAKKLKNEGYSFRMTFIGTGEMEEQLHTIVQREHLEEHVRFLGTMSPEKVREYMESAGIFIFTSSKREGWGAVLNEAMNSACAVIASHEIGSVPYLIEDNKNGLIYQSGNTEKLYSKVEFLLKKPEIQQKIGINAYKTIINTWNAEVASKRLLNLSEKLLNGENVDNLYTSGPCSPAEVIKEDWYRA